MFLEAKNITKQFVGTKALDNVNFSIDRGEVRALLGINGAGKSTLIKILSGIYSRDSGEILIDGKPVKIEKPEEFAHLASTFDKMTKNIKILLGCITCVCLVSIGLNFYQACSASDKVTLNERNDTTSVSVNIGEESFDGQQLTSQQNRK